MHLFTQDPWTCLILSTGFGLFIGTRIQNNHALIYKRLKGNIPNYLNELLVINSMHTRNTRHCNLNLFCPRYSYATESGRSFTIRSNRVWNSLPRSLSF